MTLLSVDVAKSFGTFRLDVAFTGPDDGVTVLFGPSGAGKSATLALVGGAVTPERGRVAIGARVLVDTAARHVVPQERRRIGWVYQDARLFPHLSVATNLRYGMKRAAGRAAIGEAEVVAMLGIGGLLDRSPRALSGGERQRVALGRALLSQPDLLLLDEPLAALDRERKAEILTFIHGLKQRFALPMIYVTHSEPEARALADHVVRIDGGRVVGQGPASSMLGGGDDAMVVEGVIAEQMPDSGRTRISDGGRDYVVPTVGGPIGATVRLRIRVDC